MFMLIIFNYNISDCYQYLFSEFSIKHELLIQILILSYLVGANIGVLVFIYTNVWRKFLFILANIRFVFGSVLTFATKRPSNVLLLWQDHCFINEAFPNKTRGAIIIIRIFNYTFILFISTILHNRKGSEIVIVFFFFFFLSQITLTIFHIKKYWCMDENYHWTYTLIHPTTPKISFQTN